MEKFLDGVAKSLLAKGDDLRNWQVILPSRRAGMFLQRSLGALVNKPILLPLISPIESWVESLSTLQVERSGFLLLELFATYQEQHPETTLEEFLKWGQLFLQDINEMDRHLAPADQVLSFLSDAKILEKWELLPLDAQPDLVKDYIAFWEGLPHLYKRYKEHLLSNNLAYQGMAYRKAAEECATLLAQREAQTGITNYAFVGFSAFNAAEQKLIRHLLHEKKAEMFWDLDQWLVQSKHEASHFISQYTAWPELAGRPPAPTNNLLEHPHRVQLVEVPGSALQAKVLGELLENLPAAETQEEVAIVLADEKGLLPVLHSLPPRFEQVNVTMGLPLTSTTAHSFFDRFLEMQERAEAQRKGNNVRYYHLLLTEVLNHPLLQLALHNEEKVLVRKLLTGMQENNRAYLDASSWRDALPLPGLHRLLEPLLTPQPTPSGWVTALAQFLDQLKGRMEGYPVHEPLLLEYLYHYHVVFHRLQSWLGSKAPFGSLRTLRNFLQQMLAEEPLSFYGEPLAGLQVMGMLETRALDFKRVFVLGVNEGILPTGRGGQSLLPMDIKRKFNLPTYEVKDAIYGYHFFRLLSRAEHITLLYNGRTDQLGQGEVSRFIKQLELEWLPLAKQSSWETTSYAPNINAQQVSGSAKIAKDPTLMARLEELAEHGLSPSALGNYLRNPYRFYMQQVLKLQLDEELDEALDQRYMGIAMHKCLEDFYKPFLGSYPEPRHFDDMVEQAPAKLMEELAKEFKEGSLNHGRNLLMARAAQELLVKSLRAEQQFVQKMQGAGAVMELLGLEERLEGHLALSSGRTVKLRGVADRLERINGRLRIVDYKSGAATAADVSLETPDAWFNRDKPKEKALQLLVYAWMGAQRYGDQDLDACILSLRHSKNNPLSLKIGKEEGIHPHQWSDVATGIQSLIEEIFNPDIPFEDLS